MRLSPSPLIVLFAIGCGNPADALAGRWDISEPKSLAKGSVTVGEFRDGKLTFERRSEVVGIGRIAVTTTGTYEQSGNSVTLTRTESRIDASAIKDAKLRRQTVEVMAGMAKAMEGKPLTYSLEIVDPDRIVLSDVSGSLTLTRVR